MAAALCVTACGTQNLYKLGALINFDRCAIYSSLYLPQAALGIKATNSATPANQY